MGLQELLKNPFFYIDCYNEDECWITQYENGPRICSLRFFIPCFSSHKMDCTFVLSLRPKDYHVFSFTAIRALFVIMQMRKHAGNLIRAQIWFHVKDCSRVGAWSHNIEQPNYVQYLFSQWAAARTRHSFIGLRFALVWRLEVNSAT